MLSLTHPTDLDSASLGDAPLDRHITRRGHATI
jgi:hypothetical protein